MKLCTDNQTGGVTQAARCLRDTSDLFTRQSCPVVVRNLSTAAFLGHFGVFRLCVLYLDIRVLRLERVTATDLLY